MSTDKTEGRYMVIIRAIREICGWFVIEGSDVIPRSARGFCGLALQGTQGVENSSLRFLQCYP